MNQDTVKRDFIFLLCLLVIIFALAIFIDKCSTMGKVITMYQPKEVESPILERLRELDRKRNEKTLADYQRKQRLKTSQIIKQS